MGLLLGDSLAQGFEALQYHKGASPSTALTSLAKTCGRSSETAGPLDRVFARDFVDPFGQARSAANCICFEESGWILFALALST